jgi:tetratricopeptide (TPR) repeat protein
MGLRQEAAVCAFNLGQAFGKLGGMGDLDEAEHWYRRSLELVDQRDRMGRANCLGGVGSIASLRFEEARASGRPEHELHVHLNEATQLYQEALELRPQDDLHGLAVTHNHLGVLYSNARDLDRALHHLRESIRLHEAEGDRLSAARGRANVAASLARAGRIADALDYARSALVDYRRYGASMAAKIEALEGLIARLEEALQRPDSP